MFVSFTSRTDCILVLMYLILCSGCIGMMVELCASARDIGHHIVELGYNSDNTFSVHTRARTIIS